MIQLLQRQEQEASNDCELGCTVQMMPIWNSEGRERKEAKEEAQGEHDSQPTMCPWICHLFRNSCAWDAWFSQKATYASLPHYLCWGVAIWVAMRCLRDRCWGWLPRPPGILPAMRDCVPPTEEIATKCRCQNEVEKNAAKATQNAQVTAPAGGLFKGGAAYHAAAPVTYC